MNHPAQRGSSYVELLIATILLAMLLVPGVEALQSGMRGAQIHIELAEQRLQLTSKLEEVLALSFASLKAEAAAVGSRSVPSALSDSAGMPARRLVYLAAYDGDNVDNDGNAFTGGDAGLLWVRIELEGTNQFVETLTSD